MRSAVLFLPLLALGCKGLPVPPPESGGTGVLAIQVRNQERSSSETTYPDEVWFVRVEEGADPGLAEKPLRSNYHGSGHVYLLNASPGRYHAVACSELIDGKRHYTLFPQECVRETGADLAAGGFAFLGLCQLRRSSGLDGGDPAQLHYAPLVLPPTSGSVLSTLFPRNLAYRATGFQVDRGAEREGKARDRAWKALGKAGWSDRLG